MKETLPAMKKPSIKVIMLSFALLAALSAGGGFGLGYLSETGLFAKPETAEMAPGKKPGSDGNGAHEASSPDGVSADPSSEKGSHDPSKSAGETKVAMLDPILTNIAVPPDVWIRFEAVLQLSDPLPKEVTDQIHQDFFAYFHTMRLSELSGASAFMDLKYELVARANVRAAGKVKAVYIKTFLFE